MKNRFLLSTNQLSVNNLNSLFLPGFSQAPYDRLHENQLPNMPQDSNILDDMFFLGFVNFRPA